MTNQVEQLKIKQAVLKAVRKISGVAFNKKNDGYNLTFQLCSQINVITIHLTKGDAIGDYCDAFSCSHYESGKNWNFIESLPSKTSDIPDFESNIEKAIADIFEFIKGDKL